MWDAVTGERRPTSFQLEGDWRWMLVSPDAKTLAVIGNGLDPPKLPDDNNGQKPGAVWRDSRQIQVWDLATGEPTTPVLSFPQSIDTLLFTRDGRRLLVTEVVIRQENRPRPGLHITRHDHTRLHVMNVRGGEAVVPVTTIAPTFRLLTIASDGQRMLVTHKMKLGRLKKGSRRSIGVRPKCGAPRLGSHSRHRCFQPAAKSERRL